MAPLAFFFYLTTPISQYSLSKVANTFPSFNFVWGKENF